MHLQYFRKLNTTVSTTNCKNREEVDAMICESVVVLDANSETPKGVASMKLTSGHKDVVHEAEEPVKNLFREDESSKVELIDAFQRGCS